jgi:hypothetical protein
MHEEGKAQCMISVRYGEQENKPTDVHNNVVRDQLRGHRTTPDYTRPHQTTTDHTKPYKTTADRIRPKDFPGCPPPQY